MSERIDDARRRISPEDQVYGYVTRIERRDGNNDRGAWTAIDVTIVRPIKGKWNSDTRTFEPYEQYIKATFWPRSQEDIDLYTKELHGREDYIAGDYAGTYVLITGSLATNSYRDKGTNQEKTNKTLDIQKPKLDVAFMRANYDAPPNYKEEDDDDMGLGGLDDLNDLGDF